MWRVTADNGLPRCEGYRWLRFGLLGSSFGGGLAVSGRGGATCLPLSGGGSGLGGEGQLLTGSQHRGWRAFKRYFPPGALLRAGGL